MRLHFTYHKVITVRLYLSYHEVMPARVYFTYYKVMMGLTFPTIGKDIETYCTFPATR